MREEEEEEEGEEEGKGGLGYVFYIPPSYSLMASARASIDSMSRLLVGSS